LNEESDPSICPVVAFLGFAIADEAFENPKLNDPCHIASLSVPHYLAKMVLRLKSSLCNTPILRQTEKTTGGHATASVRAWPYQSVWKYLNTLGKAAG